MTFHPSDRILRWAYAGHPPALWMRDGQELAAPKQGPPLGLDEAPAYTEGSLRLPGPASLLLYTDGLTEARRDGSFFGIEGVSAVLSALADPSPTEAIAILRVRVADFAYGP